MTEAQGWWLVVELGIIAIAAIVWLLAHFTAGSRHLP